MATVRAPTLSEEEGPGPSRFRQGLVPFFCFFLFPWAKKTGPKTKKNECTTKRVPNTRNRGCAIDCGPENFSAKSPPPRRLGLSAVSAPPPRFLCAGPSEGRAGRRRRPGRAEPIRRLGCCTLQLSTRDADMRFGVDACLLLSDGGEEDELEGGEVATLGGRGVPLLRVSEAFPSPLSGGGGGFDTRGDSGAGNPAPGPRPRLHHR